MAGGSRALVTAGVVVSALLVAGSAVALVKATDDPGSSQAVPTPSAIATPTDSPTASPTPEPTLSPTPEPTLSPTPVATTAAPTASPSAAATATASRTPAAAVTHYAYPKPTTTYKGLYVTATMNHGSGDVSETYTLKTSATDGDGTITFGGLQWGDGASVAASPGSGTCNPKPSPTTRPGPYQPEPDSRSFTFSHVYAHPGTYNVSVTINSGNTDCRPHGPASESETVSLTVHVFAPTTAT